MQIRRILFISFFTLLSLVALSLAFLSFFSTSNALEEEIGRNLTSDAVMLMEEVDMLMFERLQNIHSWSHLDIMQEGRVGDVDKRLSQFLMELELGYKGMYHKLFYIDNQNRIIAASTPTLLNQSYKPGGDWLSAKIPNGEVYLEHLQLSMPYSDSSLVIRAPVQDQYSSEMIGQLYGLLDMQQIFRLLDNAVSSRSGDRYIVLLDAEGRVIAASENLRNPKILLSKLFVDWKPEQNNSLFVRKGDPMLKGEVLVGYADSKGYLGYEHLGWSILIMQNTKKAFLPIRVLWLLFTVAILITMVLAAWASFWVSGRIAKPILALTQWIREVRQFEAPPHPNLDNVVEIHELEKAFGEMLQELEQSKENMIQAAKLAVVGEMAAIMAHEVRTPLGILNTSAQWLQRETLLSPEGKEMAQFILAESARLNRLVTTLLECARPKAPQILKHDVHNLIIHTINLLGSQTEKKQIKVDKVLKAQNPIIECDYDLLTQVFLNLLHNAIQIVPYNGMIRIQTESSLQDLTVSIADNGPGIETIDYHRLFDPFFTKREGGIGLGLTVTRQIVLMHQGQISVSKSEWGGACFTVRLPLEQD